MDTDVKTRQGVVRGSTAAGVATFKGIPYAAPPVGTFRWRAPVEPAAWKGVRDASAFADPCVQLDPYTAKVDPGVEDCLHLNVWTPDPRPAAPLPVLFFLHGGFNVHGSAQTRSKSGELLYDGAAISELMIQGPLSGDELSIAGTFTPSEAKELSRKISSACE